MKTPCDKGIDLGQTTTTVASAVFTGGIMAHHPWHIAWDDTETVLIRVFQSTYFRGSYLFA
jgi:hypothetical protein